MDDVTTKMLLTVFNNEERDHLLKNTFVLPLADFDVVMTDKTGVMKIPLKEGEQPKGIYGKKWEFAFLRVTNDAKVDWAGDKGDLGTFNMTYKMVDCMLEVLDDNTLQITYDSTKYGKDLYFRDCE